VASIRRLAAIMFTDMVGYTASAEADEAGTLDLLREQEELVRPVLSAYQGREVKSIGDGFLVEFDSALRAIQCAIDIQQRLQERNSQKGVIPIKLRIGIHLGDVEERGGDVFGDAVNIASRIRPLAAPGGLCISAEVFNQVRNKVPNRFEKLEPQVLKGIRLPQEVYRVALPWQTSEMSPRGSTGTRLAVLPLANISPDPKDEYFADGLTEELISAFSKIRELRVIARTSVGQYKSTSKSVAQIGQELDVASILEGSVRKAGDRLRITLQLIDAGTQEHIWAGTYDRKLDDVFAIQTEIAEQTAGALRLELLGSARSLIRKKPTSNFAAYNAYLRGIHAARQSKLEGHVGALSFFEEAVRLDPNFSLAYAALANTYLLLAGQTLALREVFPRAEELIRKALDLDSTSSDAHTAAGNLALQRAQDWTLAEQEFQKAISLNPSNASAHWWYAVLLKALGRIDEQIEELRTTIQLDPLWEDPKLRLAQALAMAGDIPSAIELGEEVRDHDPQNPSPHIALGFFYVRAGRVDDARKEAELLSGRDLGDSHQRTDQAVLSALLGNPADARQLAGKEEESSLTKYVNRTHLAELYAAIGEREKALDHLEREYQAGETCLQMHHRGAAFDSIRDDPRFQSLLKQMRLG
jgi:adenylate cyclase